MQVVWLKVELCRLLEEKRSAVLRLILYFIGLGFSSYLIIYIGYWVIATDSINDGVTNVGVTIFTLGKNL